MARGVRTATRGVRQGTGAPRERARAGIGLHASENVPCSATTRRGRASRWCCSTRCSRCSRCATSSAFVGSARDTRRSSATSTAALGPRRRSTVRPHLFSTSFPSRIARGLQLAVRRARWPGNVAPNHPNHADDLSHRFRRGEAHGHASEIERGRAVVALWRMLCPRTRRLGQ